MSVSVEKVVTFPLRGTSGIGGWADFFPARHGRVSFGQFAGSAQLPSELVRALTALHFEFTEFHRKISAPLDNVHADLMVVLEEYGSGIVARLEWAKQLTASDERYFSPMCRAAMLAELTELCLASRMPSGHLCRWLVRHTGIDVESIVVGAESALAGGDVEGWWKCVLQLATLDLSTVVARLLQRYVDVTPRPHAAVVLLLTFFEQVPSLFEIAAASRSEDEIVQTLEKRRQLASSFFFKAEQQAAGKHGPMAAQVEFLWKLQIAREQDYDVLFEQLSSIRFSTASSVEEDAEAAPWYQTLALAWAWLHPLDSPGPDLMGSLGARVTSALSASGSEELASVLDASIFSVLSLDFVSLFSLLANESDESVFGGVWFTALMADFVFYAGGIPEDSPDVRDAFLLTYCHWLEASGSVPRALGTRMAVDITSTLTENAAYRASEELFGLLAAGPGSKLNWTKQWLSTVKLAAAYPQAESVSMEAFHRAKHDGRIVDAVFALTVAAEVSSDVNIGACRISDFTDQEGEKVKLALERLAAACGMVGMPNLLPEYMSSGRFDFYAQWVHASASASATATNSSALVSLLVSPSCPPESVVPLATEIRNACSGKGLVHDEAVAVAKVLIDRAEAGGAKEMLLQWVTEQMVAATLNLAV